MRAVLLAFAVGLMSASALAQDKPPRTAAQINYSGFRDLTREVEAYRQDRLVTFADFQRMAREPNTIILDARSADAFPEGHIEGGINLPFTDFTDPSLPSREARRRNAVTTWRLPPTRNAIPMHRISSPGCAPRLRRWRRRDRISASDEQQLLPQTLISKGLTGTLCQ